MENIQEESSEADEASRIRELKIDVTSIQNVEKHEQATELHSLDLSVYDINTLERGIIAQVDEALADSKGDNDGELEEGEIVEDYYDKKIRLGEMTPFGTVLGEENSKSSYPDRLKRSDNAISELERYLKSQADLQKKKSIKPKTELKKENNDVEKEDKLIIKRLNDKGKTWKKRKKVIKSEKENSYRSDDDEEKNEILKIESEKFKKKSKRRCSSGSEYVPSDHSSSEGDITKKKPSKPKKEINRKRKLLMSNNLDSEDTENWDSSEDEYITKRKKTRDLDDGDVDLYTERIKLLNWDIANQELHIVSNNFKCPKSIWEKLYLYQQVAVKWFWELNRKRCGGILGDEMGLGKTVQIIAFLAGLHVSKIDDFDTDYRGLGPSIIVCPTTVMHQWVREFRAWYPPLRVVILHESGTYNGKDRSKLINVIHTYTHGILITSYSALVQFQEKILSKKWHYVILDEGHKIRNHNAQVTTVAKMFNTPHRLILSGSPLQNNLRELWSLFDFVYPGKLGTLQAFTTTFQTPIVQGGYANASRLQVVLAYKFAQILKDTITPYLLRRMKCDVDDHIHLPPKTEQILFCRLTDEQRHYYKGYVNNLNIEDVAQGRAKMFIALFNLRKICNHPDLYSGGPSKNFTLTINDTKQESDSFGYWKNAGKMIVINTLLKIWHEQDHRVLLFTQGKKMLIILEEFVKRRKYKYLKLDGQTCVSTRQPIIDKFNKDKSYFVMLLTTKVGGLGVNLTGADRVVIYDPDWNPATDTQARERAWRIGQQKEVTVYRLITAGTIEEKIYHRQIFKQFLSNKVLKDPRQRRFFKSNDLIELFTLNETVKDGTNETAAIVAGTNSEIKIDSKAFKEAYNKPKSLSDVQNTRVTFSESKIEEMRKLAQKLSKKLINNITSKNDDVSITKQDNNIYNIYGTDGNLIPQKAKEILNETKKTNDQSVIKEPNNSLDVKEKCSKKTIEKVEISHRKHKKGKHDKFEGKVVPHLLKWKRIKKNKNKETEIKRMTQDEYVLHNLFTKSGLETVLKHDTILESGPSDYAIVEAEAEKVAQEAVKQLKESRVEVSQVHKPIFGSALSKSKQNESNSLIEAIKKRNMIVESVVNDKQLVRQVVSWLNSQGGTASTDEIVNEFKNKIGSGKSPLFKSLLSKVAQFYRAPDNIGYWTVRDEFK